MKNFKFYVAGFLALLMTSCASYKTERPIMAIGGNNINTYVTADLDYENAKQIEGEVETSYFLCFPTSSNKNTSVVSSNRYKGLNKRESQALYNALQKSNVDIILEPRFETEKHSYFLGLIRKGKTTVKGWGVKIKGLKEDKSMRNDVCNFTSTFSSGGSGKTALGVKRSWLWDTISTPYHLVLGTIGL